MSEQRIKILVASVLFGTVLVAYIETMATSTSFWDAGEFITTAYILGIPHPPATPLYVVLGRVFSLLPLPAMTVPMKINFMSALFGALGIVVLFLLIVELVRQCRGEPRSIWDRVLVYGSGLVGALFTAWSNTYWTNAIEAEVYSISSFVMGLTTLLALRWSRNPEPRESTRSIYLIIYLLSLGVGFHLGTVLTYPAIALYALLIRKKSFRDADLVIFSFGFFLFLMHVNLKFSGAPALLALIVFLILFAVRAASGQRFVPIATGLFLLGLTIHLFLLIRSAQNPAIDEANPETLGNLMAVLRREQYPPSNVFVRKASWDFQIVDHFWRYCKEQYELVREPAGRFSGQRLALLPILVGFGGIAWMAWRNFKSFLLIFVTFVLTSFGMIVFLNFSDSEVRERDYFYSPAFYFFGIFIGLGAAAFLDGFFGGKLEKARSRLDRLGLVGGLAIFLALTCLLYARYHFEHDRTRERVPWGYGYNILAGLDENALLFTNGDNDTFPLWYQQEVENFRRDVRVLNLSLLNTSWYIFQLRDNEPKVDITWSDEQIDNLQGAIVEDRIYEPRDLAIRHILRRNFGKRPIYFAVTIPRHSLADYEDYLILEGLVHRFTDQKGKDQRDLDKIEYNATQVYRYDGILKPDGTRDDTVYRGPNQENLVQNYAAAFVRLGQAAESRALSTQDETTRQGAYKKAVGWYHQALEISPSFEVLKAQLGELHLRVGQDEQAIRLFEELVQGEPEDDRWLFKLAETLLLAGRHELGLEKLGTLTQRNPDDEFVFQYLVQVLLELDRPAQAESVVVGWEASRPGRSSLREFMEAARSGLTTPILEPRPIGE